jgi:hypothetical protein
VPYNSAPDLVADCQSPLPSSRRVRATIAARRRPRNEGLGNGSGKFAEKFAEGPSKTRGLSGASLNPAGSW